MPTITPNPDTHCPTCHEPLSEFGHCWQHHWPPMDPSQDATTQTTTVTTAQQPEAFSAEASQWEEGGAYGG